MAAATLALMIRSRRRYGRSEHQVRGLPVIDGKNLVGLVAGADTCDEAKIGGLAEAICR
jgi:CBS domain-containing protein